MDATAFKGMRLAIATPMYRAEVCDAYEQSRRDLDRYLNAAGIGYYPHTVRDTYLPRARNVLAAAFLRTDATHQLLLDADMGFDAADVVRMLYHVAVNPKMWVLGAAYPQRSYDWERVKKVVLANPEITAAQLERVAPGHWTFSGLLEGQHDLGMPVELKSGKPHVATGIMVVAREAYQKLQAQTPNYLDKRMEARTWRFFHADVDAQDDIWVGEDVWFCRELKKAGVHIWLAPWVKSEHWGPQCFYGDAAAVTDAGMELPQ